MESAGQARAPHREFGIRERVDTYTQGQWCWSKGARETMGAPGEGWVNCIHRTYTHCGQEKTRRLVLGHIRLSLLVNLHTNY